VFNICDTVGCTYSGLQADSRVQVNMGNQIAEEYYDVYGRYPDVDVFVTRFSSVVQEYTQKGGYRPFGTLMLFAGTSKGRPALYQVDPSGSYRSADTCSIGKEYAQANNFMQRRLQGLDDNIANCVNAMREFAGREIGPEDVDIGVYYRDRHQFRVFSLSEVREQFESSKRE
jgi:20S proteasome subunit alpha 2